MIPVLFPASATTFTTQGLGKLSDAISCKVSEERNGAYELEMEYPVDGIHWGDVAASKIIVAKPNATSNPQAFRIYRITKPLKKRCMVYAEHISYQLSHIPVMPFTAGSFSAALSALVTNAAETCPFSVWTDKTVTNTFTLSAPMSFRALLGGTQGSLLDVYGTAEYEFDNYTVKAHLNRGSNKGVVLRYGKNITDLEQEETIAKTVTGICPYWLNSETGAIVTLTEKVLWSSNAANFPYARTVIMDFSQSFEEQPTETQLRNAAQSYIYNNNVGVPEVNIKLSFVNLWESEEFKNLTNIEYVSLCDTIKVEFELLDVSTTAKVVKTVYDVLKDRYESIEIGDAKTTLAKQISTVEQTVTRVETETISYLEGVISSATAKITGGRGGYVKLNYNANGQPDELLILSAATEATSEHIIRMNQAGIGFSTDYGNTYATAWTIDGQFSASFITAGTMSAARITTGTLQDANGYTTFDLSTGELTMTKGAITLGVAVNGVYPFSVDDTGSLYAVSATLVDASVSGTITTENGYYKAMLDAGYLRMYYDGTLYAQFGSTAWSANTAKRGSGVYASSGASYIFFGKESSGGAYVSSYIINYDLDAGNNEIAYGERHLFYGTARFIDGVTMGSTLTLSGAVTANASVTIASGLYFTTGHAYFYNGYGVQLRDTSDVYSLALYMNSSDEILLANTTHDVRVYGKHTYLGNVSYPTVISGSNVSAPRFVQSGSERITVTANTLTYETVNFDTAFPAIPHVVATAERAGTFTSVTVSNISASGFRLYVQNSSAGTFTIHWVAVYTV